MVIRKYGAEWEFQCTGIEESGRNVCEIPFRHLNHPVNNRAMDRNGSSHGHVLWSLGDVSIDTKEVGVFESLEHKTLESG